MLQHYDRRKMEARWEFQEIHDSTRPILGLVHIPYATSKIIIFLFENSSSGTTEEIATG